MADWEKVVNGLECCVAYDYKCNDCLYQDDGGAEDGCYYDELKADALALLKSLNAFKAYFDSFYGEGLEIANYHQNGAMEPFDNFYDSAMEEYENAKCADTQRDYQAAVEMTEYCERYESTYNPEDGSM